MSLEAIKRINEAEESAKRRKAEAQAEEDQSEESGSQD